MKDYKKMSRAELLTSIKQLKAQHTQRSNAQLQAATSARLDHEARLRAILETAIEGIITINERGLIESANLAAEKMFGYPAREIIGKNVNVLMPMPHHAAHDGYLENYRQTGAAKIIGIGREVSGRRKDGSLFPMDLSVSAVKLADRRLFTGFIRDITERKTAEKALRHYEALVESSDDAIIGKTLEGIITSWNKGAELVFGYARNEVIGKPISILIPTDRENEEPAILKKIRSGVSVDHYETVRRRKDGMLIDISVTISPIRNQDGEIIGASKVARDITERKRLEKEILEISEREQRRIGQDLHDGLCQHLAGIEMLSQVLAQKLARKSKDGSARATEIAKAVRDAISQTRLLARGLSPVNLESEGLMSALAELALNTQIMFRVQCVLDCPKVVKSDNHAAATHLFRIAQEAVSNAIKHGKAKKISIRLTTTASHLQLRVNDDGIGIPEKLLASSGMGLRIMRSRIGMVGGTLAIERQPAGGTSVMFAAPKKIESNGRQK